MLNDSLDILLVEDEPADALLVKRALEKFGCKNPIVHVVDGEEALDYFFRRNRFADRRTDQEPILILLDLRLPKVDGHEVLRQIKETEVGRQIPVVVLTTSPDRPDMVKAYNMGANAYVTKPFSLESFSTMTQALKSFWIDQNRTIFHVT